MGRMGAEKMRRAKVKAAGEGFSHVVSRIGGAVFHGCRLKGDFAVDASGVEGARRGVKRERKGK